MKSSIRRCSESAADELHQSHYQKRFHNMEGGRTGPVRLPTITMEVGVSLVSRSSWHPANDNGPCSTPVLASRQRIGGIKPPTIVATAAPANDNRVNIAVHRDSGS